MNGKAFPTQRTVTVAQSSAAAMESERRHLLAQVGTVILMFTWLTMACLSSSATAMMVLISSPTGDFANASLSGWEERSFAGNTSYELVEEQGTRVLKAHTNGKASILYREQSVDLQNTPFIEWSWKVDRIYEGIDERSRQGDDFPARLYVVAKTGFLPWETLAINYVWSADAPIGDSWANPFTSKARMVVVQTGNQHVGSWVKQQRNVADDFKTFFDTDITDLSGYAVMVDGDNSQNEAMAWFGQILFSAN